MNIYEAVKYDINSRVEARCIIVAKNEKEALEILNKEGFKLYKVDTNKPQIKCYSDSDTYKTYSSMGW